MRNLIITLTAATALAGCGGGTSQSLSGGAKAATKAQAGGDRGAIELAVSQWVYLRHPHSDSGISQVKWIELGRTDDANELKFDFSAQLDTGLTLPDKKVEFYGRFDKHTGKLVPGSMAVLTANEQTWKHFQPAGK
jgi:hypothetical protein